MPSKLHLEWDLPETALQEPFRSDLIATVKQEVALRLYASGKISSGFGAVMLDTSRRDFVELARQRRIPLFSYADGELEAEVAALEMTLDQPPADGVG